jgi:hypothetical protein
MSNLLPSKTKQELKTDYRVRRVATGLFLGATIFLVSALLLVPSYFLSARQARLSAGDLQSLEDSIAQETGVASKDVIQETNSKLEILATSINHPDPVPGKLINQMLAHTTGGGITITAFIYNRTPESAQISLQGIAKDRKTLGAFANALEADPMFEQVDYPLDALISEQDLKFSLTMKVTGTETTQASVTN